MRHYEVIVVLSPVLSQEESSETWGRIKELIANHGGDLTQEEQWGMRRLAYPIRKAGQTFLEGNYLLTRFSTDTVVPRELETHLTLSEGVIRFLVVRSGEPKPVPPPPPEPIIVEGEDLAPVAVGEAVGEEPVAVAGDEAATEEPVAVTVDEVVAEEPVAAVVEEAVAEEPVAVAVEEPEAPAPARSRKRVPKQAEDAAEPGDDSVAGDVDKPKPKPKPKKESKAPVAKATKRKKKVDAEPEAEGPTATVAELDEPPEAETTQAEGEAPVDGPTPTDESAEEPRE